MHRSASQNGFSLIEIAIVLVVLGLLLAGLIGPMGTRIEQEERERTRASLEEIKEALYGFAVVHGRLPCPDSDGSNDGLEDRTTTCTALVGNLPWVDLVVPELDAWGRPFRYGVTQSFGDDVTLGTVTPPVTPPGTCTSLPAQSSFALCTAGNIIVRDGDTSVPGTTQIANDVAAVVLSHGKYRFQRGVVDPPSPHEEENFEDSGAGDTPGTIVERGYTGETGREFDDLVVWIPHLILKNRMIMAGKLP